MGRVRKVEVGPGVAWVEAPEIGMSILCGCPADVVKSLMKAGLIAPTEKAGRHTETGPNAILLSDVMLQNGSFCNLAEFPVLQMLYRQGMIIPGHPNNRGERPLLIGNAQQVDAQLHYIHRGNYGLIGRDEVAATGLPKPLVDEVLAYKKRFAFGHIRPPSELLDTAILDDRPLELKGGLRLTRLGLNLFEFSLGGERVVVDLNLGPGETFKAPYDLPFTSVRRDYFSVIHSGDGNGWDMARPSMGSVLVYQGRIFLIDAGPNINYTLDALGIGVNEISGLFHTHCHDDHFAGLTTLLRADHRLKYFATPLVRASVTKKLSALMAINESMFSDCFEVHDLEFDRWNDIEGLDVMPLLSPHPVETSVFLFRALWRDGYRTYAHLADVVAIDVLRGMITEPGNPGISESFFHKVIQDYRMPADLKKIDIGGGLIHGNAEDFRGDDSERLLLSHIERPLTAREAEIGTTPSFGATHILVEGNQDYDLRAAFEYLHVYFPQVTHPELAMLLSCNTLLDLPGTTLLRQGQTINDLHLILSGTVERVTTGGVRGAGFTAGSLLGIVAGLAGKPATNAYRCRSYVRSLQIPIRLMQEFLRRNRLGDQLSAVVDVRSFLRSTELLGESLAETTLTRLAQSAIRKNYGNRASVDPKDQLALVMSGSVSLSEGGETVRLGPGDIFNEGRAMFAQKSVQKGQAEEASELCLLPADAIRQVPLMRWTLLELMNRRKLAALLPFRYESKEMAPGMAGVDR